MYVQLNSVKFKLLHRYVAIIMATVKSIEPGRTRAYSEMSDGESFGNE